MVKAHSDIETSERRGARTHVSPRCLATRWWCSFWRCSKPTLRIVLNTADRRTGRTGRRCRTLSWRRRRVPSARDRRGGSIHASRWSPASAVRRYMCSDNCFAFRLQKPRRDTRASRNQIKREANVRRWTERQTLAEDVYTCRRQFDLRCSFDIPDDEIPANACTGWHPLSPYIFDIWCTLWRWLYYPHVHSCDIIFRHAGTVRSFFT